VRMADRLLLLATGFWVGGVAAWAPIAGYLLAPHARAKGRLVLERLRCAEPAVDDSDELKDLTELRRPNDPSGMLTESQMLRLRPVNSLRRKRRSRKIRRAEPKEDKLLPLVPGARQSVSESIIAAYSGDTLESKQTAGEDYWVDASSLQEEVRAKRRASLRKKAYARDKTNYKAEKLKEELASPYKNNVISYIVVGVGVVAVLFAAFPGLLEYPSGTPLFPDQL